MNEQKPKQTLPPTQIVEPAPPRSVGPRATRKGTGRTERLTRVVFPGSSRSQSKRLFPPPKTIATPTLRAQNGASTPRTGNGGKKHGGGVIVENDDSVHSPGWRGRCGKTSRQPARVCRPSSVCTLWKFLRNGAVKVERLSSSSGSVVQRRRSGGVRSRNGNVSGSGRAKVAFRTPPVGGRGVGRTSSTGTSVRWSRSLTAVGMLVRLVRRGLRERRSPQT